MITGELKNKVDKIWTDLWAGGITNPLTVIEQLTYLMFIKALDEKDLEAESSEAIGITGLKRVFPDNKQELRWGKFKNLEARKMYQIVQEEVFPFIKGINADNGSSYAKYMRDAIFMIPTPQLLQKAVSGIDSLELKGDIKGDIYEYMLSKIATAGTNGQFRTPRHIIKMMVDLMKPNPDDTICDPACGTSGFLMEASEYIREHHSKTMTQAQWKHYSNEMFTGYDIEQTMLRIGAMNMILHGITSPRIEYTDSLSKQNVDKEQYTLILANPPFKGTVDTESISQDLLSVTDTKKTELLFVALFLRSLKKGGRCACIVPDGVLFGANKAHKQLRKELVDNQYLQGVISMPSGVFKPYAGVSTAILLFTKTNAGGTDKVWFYDMVADGFTLDDKRTPTDKNDIADIIARFENLKAERDRKRSDKSFMVDKADIVANDYDLSINKYKETEHIAVEYPHPKELIAKIKTLEEEIIKGLVELEGMIE